MLSEEMQRVTERAKAYFEQELRSRLEPACAGQYVCIEPDSKDFFLGGTFDEACNLALDAHPDRLTHTLRIGHAAALHLGAISS